MAEAGEETTRKRFLVTGASSGIGKAVAQRLASQREHVIVAARSAGALNELANAYSPYVLAVPVDLSTASGCEELFEAIPANCELSGILHAAGSLVPLQPFVEVDPEELVDHLRIHVAAAIRIVQQAVAQHGVGRVLFVDSYSASTPRDGWSAYSMVKSTVQMAARCMRQELAGTPVVRIFPGAVRTQVVDAVLSSDAPTKDVFQEMQQRGAIAEPSEVAEFIVALMANTPEEFLSRQESWDFNSTEDQALLRTAQAQMGNRL